MARRGRRRNEVDVVLAIFFVLRRRPISARLTSAALVPFWSQRITCRRHWMASKSVRESQEESGSAKCPLYSFES